MATFAQFCQLPENVRTSIWKEVTSFTRVVGIHEVCHKVAHITVLKSTTRSPAILGVCRESRRVGLEKYDTIDQKPITPSDLFKPLPIYVNPEVDIIYRGRKSCRDGCVFRIACKDEEGNDKAVPIAMTRTLAVDSRAITRLREPIASVRTRNRSRHGDYFEDIMGRLTQEGKKNCTDVMSAAEKGLREIVFVVGNDDDLSEITLIPLADDAALYSAKEKLAVEAAEKFSLSIRAFCDSADTHQPFSMIPTFRVMTVKRKPLKDFALFSKLPLEIQYLIWNYAACQKPTVRFLSHDPNETLPDALIEKSIHASYRLPAIHQVCRISRNIAQGLKPSETALHKSKDQVYTDYLSLLRYEDEPRVFAKGNGKNVGVEWKRGKQLRFSAAIAKAFPLLDCVWVIVGRKKMSCDHTYVRAPRDLKSSHRKVVDKLGERIGMYISDQMVEDVHDAWDDADLLIADIDAHSKKWKSYQNRRLKLGKASDDWIVPKVEVGFLVPISETLSPYSSPELWR